MKRKVVSLILLACVLFCIGNYFYHTVPYQFEIEGAQTVKIFSGTTGESIEVSDTDVIDQLTDMINSRRFTRGDKEAVDGYAYALVWYDADGDVIEMLYLLGRGSTVIKAKSRRHYDLTDGFTPIDLAYIESLFEATS